MTPERLADIKKMPPMAVVLELIAHIEAQDKRIKELEADKARLDKLISFMVDENDYTVILRWDNYQDFAQVRLLDGIVVGEASDSDAIQDTMDGEQSSALVIRQAIDNAGGNNAE